MTRFWRQRSIFCAVSLFLSASLQAQTQFNSTGGASGTNTGSTTAAASPYGVPIPVSGLSGTISNVIVKVNGLTSTDDTSMILAVVSPSGKKLGLIYGSGSGSAQASVNVNFSDSGAALTEFSQFTSATYKPVAYADYMYSTTYPFPSPVGVPSVPATAGSATLASVFNGDSPNGTWNLYLANVFDATSSFSSWSITITTANAATTATTVSSSSTGNTSYVGDSVTFTASVTSSGSPVTSGAATFSLNGTVVSSNVALNGLGQAAFNTSSLVEGADSISVTYNGNSSFAQSTGTLSQTVNRHSTVTNVTSTTGTFCNTGVITIPATGTTGGAPGVASSPYPSRVFVGKGVDPNGTGQPVDYSGTLTKLTIDLKNFSLTNENGAAMLLVGPTGAAYDFFSNVGNTPTSNSASNLTITLSDSGASQLPTSAISSGTFQPTVYVNTAIGALDSFASPAPASGITYAAPAGAITLADEFNGKSPNGTWLLYLDDQQSGTGSLASGWCIDITVSTSNAATTTTLTSSATSNDQFTDQAVTFTATVTSNSSAVTTGTVTFTDGTTTLQSGVVPNANGKVTYVAAASSLTQGTHNITATYSGATGFGTSAATLSEQVDKHTVVTGAQYCNPGTITIPTASTLQSPTPYPVHVFVGGSDPSSTPLAGTIKSVSVTLNGLTASFPSDLQSMLTGPGASSGAGPGGTLSESLDFFSHTSNGTAVTGLNLTFADTASAAPGSGTLVSGSFKPASTRTNTYSSPAPSGPYQYAATEGTATFATAFASNSLSPNGTWSFYFGTAAGSATMNSACVTFTTNQPALTIQKQHSGSFVQGGIATYTITVSNPGPGPTEGAVTVTEIPPTGMTLSTLSGNNWTCNVSSKTCNRSDSLAQSSSYDTITATLAVSPTAATGTNALTNQASVTGGGASNSPTASDPTTITAAATLSVTKTHTGTFAQGSAGQYVVTVHNAAGAGTTSGTTSMSDSMPTGYTISSFSSGTWTCSGIGTQAALCTSTQTIAGGSSFPVIDINVNVPANSPLTVTNTANAFGGGDPVHAALGSAATGSDSNASVTQVASSVAATTGSSQSAKISTQFTTQLQATVKDAGSNPVSGITVTFTAPANNASGTFADSNTNITTAVTNSSGIATAAAFKANNTIGGYTVTASAPGVSPNASFSLTNTTGNPAGIAATGGASQSATISTQFGTQLQATVKDAGSNGVQGVTVTFTAPGTSASGTFADSRTNTTTAVTNASGIATAAAFTANATAGAYSVTASTPGVTPNASFSLTNNAGSAASVAATGGASQATAVSTQFTSQLQATVKDSGSNLLQGVTVTFSAPGSGATGTFADSRTNITTAVTNASGVATAAAFTANGIAGGYSVLASVVGVAPNASFSLTNTGTPATVTSIGSTTANGSYTTGASLAIVVTFSKAVNVTGTPQLALNSGGTANYASGSGTSALTFLYVVAAGQNSTRLDALSNGALLLNGGTIQDAGTTAADLLLPTPGAAGSLGANTNIVIDTTAPTVVSYSVQWGAQTYNLAGSSRSRLPWQITGIQVVFSKPIATANAAGLSGVSAAAVSGAGTNTLTWSFGPLTLGTYSTVLAGTGANALKDVAGNPLGGGNGFFRTFRILCGDFNDDGIVNSQDFTLVNAARNQAYNIFADINGDGVVDTNDVQIVRNNLGSSLPLPPS